MYELVYNIIDHVWQSNTNLNSTQQQYIYMTCACLIIILMVVFIDLVYRVFRHFWR